MPVCVTCNDTHQMILEDKTVSCTHCPYPCHKCRDNMWSAYCGTTPCVCSCHAQHLGSYGRWNGMCPARKHGADFPGQLCMLCASAAPQTLNNAQQAAVGLLAATIEALRATEVPDAGDVLTAAQRLVDRYSGKD